MDAAAWFSKVTFVPTETVRTLGEYPELVYTIVFPPLGGSGVGAGVGSGSGVGSGGGVGG